MSLNSIGNLMYKVATFSFGSDNGEYKPAPLSFDKQQKIDIELANNILDESVKTPQNSYKPGAFDMSGVPQRPTSTYQPVVFDGIKATTMLKPLSVTDHDILQKDNTLVSTDIIWIKSIISNIDPNNYRESVSLLGYDHQKKTSDIPQYINSISELESTRLISYLDELKSVISSLSIKGGFFKGSFESRITKSKSRINDLKNLITSQLPIVENMVGIFNTCSHDIDVAMHGIDMVCIAISIAIDKVEDSLKDLFLNRISSLHMSKNVILQTKQIIGVKNTNISNLISIARDTIFTALPTMFNQLEIIELQEQSGKIDDVVLNNVLKSQNDIVQMLNKPK